jgi:PhnB protein
MKSNPYLMFNGQCDAAFKFYEKHLGGKTVFRLTNGESPAAKETPPERQHQVLHARFEVGGTIIMASDAPPERYDKPQGFFVSLDIKTPEEAERIFKALSENGKILMPIGETFWAYRFGMLVDQFDIPWMINCEKPNQ